MHCNPHLFKNAVNNKWNFFIFRKGSAFRIMKKTVRLLGTSFFYLIFDGLIEKTFEGISKLPGTFQ